MRLVPVGFSGDGLYFSREEGPSVEDEGPIASPVGSDWNGKAESLVICFIFICIIRLLGPLPSHVSDVLLPESLCFTFSRQ